MLNDIYKLDRIDISKELYIVSSIILLLLCLFFVVIDKYSYAFLIFVIPFVIACAIRFNEYYKEIFVCSLFIGQYFQWPFRIQIGLLITFAIIFFFVTNNNSLLFNKLILPKNIKYSALSIISAIYLSSIVTSYRSFFSVYYASIFFSYVILSYVIFRSIRETRDINNLLYLFVKMTFITGLTIIFQIYYTGYLRSTGVVGFCIMDLSAVALIIVLFSGFILSKVTKKNILYGIIIFIILITTQSRFAWLSFLLTFIYGLVICFKHSNEAKVNIKKRIPIFSFIFLIGLALLFLFGLNKVLVYRISDINFSFFQNPESAISNSLESRILIWIVAINTFLHNPLTGVGYYMFYEASYHYNILPDVVYNMLVKDLDAHTTFLNILCETGIIGLTCFITYLIIIFRLSLISIKISYEKEDKKVSIILNLIVFFIFVNSIYSGAYTFGSNALFMHMVFGLTVGNYCILKSKYKNL
jgi:O-antigen ligase